MVSRSEDPVMNLVTQEQLTALTDNLNNTMENLRAKFAEQDQKFGMVEQRVMIMESAVQARLLDAEDKIVQLGQMSAEVKNNLEHVFMKAKLLEDSVRHLEDDRQRMEMQMRPPDLTGLTNATMELQRLMNLAEQCAKNHQERISKMEAQSSGGMGRRDILDPRQLVVDKLSGEKKEFSEWRESVEVYISRFYPEAEKIMPYIRRAEVPIERPTFEAAAASANVDLESVKWEFEEIQKDAGNWLKTKLWIGLSSSVAAAGDKFFNMQAQLNQEYDKLSEETEGQLHGDFASLAGKQSKSLTELKKNLVIFEKSLKEFRDRLGKDVEPSLKKSVLIAMLDPSTRMDFVKSKILNDYTEMRKQLTILFCHGLNEGAVPMEVNSMEKAGQKFEDPAPMECTPCEQQPGLYAIGNQNHGKGVQCWNCLGYGHPARMCPKPLMQEWQQPWSPKAKSKVRMDRKEAGSNRAKARASHMVGNHMDHHRSPRAKVRARRAYTP